MVTESHFGTGHPTPLTWGSQPAFSLCLWPQSTPFPRLLRESEGRPSGKHQQYGWTALYTEQYERYVWSSTLTFNKNPSLVSGSWVTFTPLEHATHSYMRAWSLNGDLSTCSALSLRRHRQAVTDPSLVSWACGCIILQCLAQVRHLS
jgi:hypothetical protein